MDAIGLILSSAVVGAMFSSFATLYVTERNYRNEYYKIIVEKRFQAHEVLNGIISKLKIAIPDTDGRSYHTIFAGTTEEYDAFMVGLAVNAPDFWVSRKTRETLLELNKEFFRCHLLLNKMDGNLKEIGKMEYKVIGGLRDKLEKCLLSELPSLHKVRNFLKRKTIIEDYNVFDLRERPHDYRE